MLEVAEFPGMLMIVVSSSMFNVVDSACRELSWLKVAEFLEMLLIVLCATSFGGWFPWEFVVCRAAGAWSRLQDNSLIRLNRTRRLPHMTSLYSRRLRAPQTHFLPNPAMISE